MKNLSKHHERPIRRSAMGHARMRVREKRRGSSARDGRNYREKLEGGVERRTAEVWSAESRTEGNR
jgi:hypothetical protein